MGGQMSSLLGRPAGQVLTLLRAGERSGLCPGLLRGLGESA